MYCLKLLSYVVLLFTLNSCSKNSGEDQDPGGGTNPPPVVIPVTPLINLPAGWKVSTTLGTNFPSGIQVFGFDSLYQNKKMKAFCVVFDPRNPQIEFKPVLSATSKRVSEFFSQEPGLVYVAINGGFFGGTQSFSLVKQGGTVLSPNIKVLNRNFNGTSTAYYPTRAAFGISATGVPATAWVYSIGSGNTNVFAYPTASPNAEGSAPQPVPDENFPSGGAAWDVPNAIGGSPMLLKGGSKNITATAELIAVNNTSSRPRSAIGHTANGLVVMVAVEGDNTAGGYAGVSLDELATLMQDLSCNNAINLDGGGSTSLVIGGQLTLRPGDGTERGVISAIILKRK